MADFLRGMYFIWVSIFVSLAEGVMPAVWEDITDAIAMTILNGSATLLVTVSARYIVIVCFVIDKIQHHSTIMASVWTLPVLTFSYTMFILLIDINVH